VRSNPGQKAGVPASRDKADRTLRVPLPPDETGPVPVRHAHAEVHWFGVPPLRVLLGVSTGSFLVSIVLLATGTWPVGLVMLGVGALLCSAFLEVARRRPDSTLTRMSSDAANAFELMRARSRALAATQHQRAERAVIESERRAVRLRLAEALQSEDEAEADALRERLVQLDRAEERLGVVLQERLARTDDRIRRARLSAARTVVVPPDGEDSRRPAA